MAKLFHLILDLYISELENMGKIVAILLMIDKKNIVFSWYKDVSFPIRKLFALAKKYTFFTPSKTCYGSDIGFPAYYGSVRV